MDARPKGYELQPAEPAMAAGSAEVADLEQDDDQAPDEPHDQPVTLAEPKSA